MWKTGHSLIKSKMKETGAPLAGEMSGHIFFAHEYYGFDDALYAAVRLIRAVTRLGGSLTALRSRCRTWSTRPNCASRSTRAASSRSSRRCSTGSTADGAEVDRTDGARVTTADGWWLLRASNTQDVLVARAEANDEAGLDAAGRPDRRAARCPASSAGRRRGMMPRLHPEPLLFCLVWAALALAGGLLLGWQAGAILSVGLMLVIMPASSLVLTRTDSFPIERQVRWGILADRRAPACSPTSTASLSRPHPHSRRG